MRRSQLSATRNGRRLAAAALLLASAGAAALPVRITTAIDETERVELQGHVHPALATSVDLGAADPQRRAERIVMVLRPSAAQAASLQSLLRDQQTKGRPDYHRWLTPAEFGRRFGLATADLRTVRRWLKDQGFDLEPTASARRSIVFSGTVEQVNQALHAQLHEYLWHGERHLANAANPSVPKALAPVIRGFASLHDFRLQPQFRRGHLRSLANLTNGTHALGPADFATIYDLEGVYAAGTTGAGRTIAVIGRSNVKTVDLQTFRSSFGLSAALPTVFLAGADPGRVPNDETESDLDLEWAAGIAPAATVDFVTAKSTGTTDGIVLAAQYAVDHNLADVITVSYGACESAGDLSGGTTWAEQTWEQAAAQGTSVFISSGDAGAAGCDTPSASSATHGLGVNLLCTSPYSTCVGGTEFSADVPNPGAYWSANNTPGTEASALGYIGEAVWNDSGTVSGGAALWSSGGGASLYYAKPAWQYTIDVPSDGQRDVPDLAFAAGANHDPYLIYSSDGNSTSTLEGIGGTSAAAPSMAALVALVAQKTGGRLGAVNPVLYGLAALQAAGGATVFHTITSGNNSVPGQSGFSASAALPYYNQATGLGSVDGGALIAHFSEFPGSAGFYPVSVVVPPTASVGAATISLTGATSWTATVSGGSWLTVSPTSGTGTTLLTYGATQNGSPAARTGTITIAGQSLTITQAAASGAALLTLSASSLSFGTDPVGSVTNEFLFVSDTGGSTLDLGAIGLTGAGAGAYSDRGSCATGLALTPGASCYLDIRFDPGSTGTQSADLTIGTASVTLSGVGAASVTPTDGPLPFWSYLAFGGLLVAVGSARRGR
jgi:subtilase family serine protease